jgi:hypothetical protein
MFNKFTISLLITKFLILLMLNQSTFASLFDTPVAMITAIEGKVSFENTTNRQIDFGTDIFIGDMLKTAKNSTVSLTFYNGCRQETIDQKTLIQVGNTKSVVRSGQFKQVEALDCTIPQVVLQESDSHLKAGMVVRGVNTNNKLPNFSSLIPSADNNAVQLRAWTNHGKQPTFRLGEAIILHFLSNQDAYVIVNYYASNGELYQLTPELLLDDNRILSKKLYSLGNKGAGLIAGLPTGIDSIQIIASNKPIQIDNNTENAEDYYQSLKDFIKNNQQQIYSQKHIKLTISQ